MICKNRKPDNLEAVVCKKIHPDRYLFLLESIKDVYLHPDLAFWTQLIVNEILDIAYFTNVKSASYALTGIWVL